MLLQYFVNGPPCKDLALCLKCMRSMVNEKSLCKDWIKIDLLGLCLADTCSVVSAKHNPNHLSDRRVDFWIAVLWFAVQIIRFYLTFDKPNYRECDFLLWFTYIKREGTNRSKVSSFATTVCGHSQILTVP